MTRRAIREAYEAHAKAVAAADARLAVALADALDLPPENDTKQDPIRITDLDMKRAETALRKSGRLR